MVYFIYLDLTHKYRKKIVGKSSLKNEKTRVGGESWLSWDGKALIELIFRDIDEGFAILDSQECFVYVNKQVEKDLLKKREFLLGKRISEVVGEEHGADNLLHGCRLAIKRNKTLQFQTYRFKTRRWYFMHIYPFNGGGGSNIYRHN